MSDEKPDEAAERPAPGTDVTQIDASDLEQRAFPESLPSEYRVVISAGAFEAIKAHAQSDTSIELCGVLAGNLFADDDGAYLAVEKAIEGIATRRTGSQVTFTHETWERIHKHMDAECPDLRIVGWYHTHPGFGIFLSEMDQFIQDNFFNMPHQVAFVYDPVAERRGLFVWRDGKSSRLRRYWLGGRLVYDEEGAPAPEPTRAEPEPREEADDFDRRPPRRVVEQPEAEPPPLRWSMLWFAVALVALFAAYWFGSSSARVAALQTGKQAEDFRALIRTGLFRDGLGFELERMQSRLNDVHNQLQTLGDKLGKDADGKPPEALATSIDGVLGVHREVGRIRDRFTKSSLLAERMGRVANMPTQIAVLDQKQDAMRMLIAELYVLEARVLTMEQVDPELKRHLASEFAKRAVELEPKLRELIEQQTPGLLPKAQPATGTGDSGKK